MDVTEAILKRRSIRNMKPDPVDKEKIEKVLEAARRAPSWGNTQPWRFIVVQDKTKIEELSTEVAAGQPQVAGAPVLLVEVLAHILESSPQGRVVGASLVVVQDLKECAELVLSANVDG